MKKHISVIIPTRNRSIFVAAALASLCSQNLDNDVWEVIVVDNGSLDDTWKVVNGFSSNLANLKCVQESSPGLHAGRHRGLREAAGEIIVYADDDIEASVTWLQAIHQAFLDQEVVLVGGNNLPLFYGIPPIWLQDLWNRKGPDGSFALPSLSIQERQSGVYTCDPYMVWGCNFSIRKEILLEAGGFHPDGMPQELIRFRGDGESHISNYIARNKLKCIFDSNATVYHKVTPERMTLEYFCKRGFNQGISDSYTQLRNQASLKKINLPSVPSKHTSFLREKAQILKSKLLSGNNVNPACRAYDTGYKKGYDFHQLAYHEDREVYAWVHKEDYF